MIKAYVEDLTDRQIPPQSEDEIGSVLSSSGASAPSVHRLGRVATDMTQLEWKLLRSQALRAGGGDASATQE